MVSNVIRFIISIVMIACAGCASSDSITVHGSEKADSADMACLEEALNLIQNEEYVKGCALLEGLIDRCPDLFRAKRALQDAAMRAGEEEAALEVAEESLKGFRNAATLTLMARATNNTNEALTLLEEALSMDETFVWAHYGIAFLLLKENRVSQFDKIRDHLERALEFSSGFGEARLLYIEILSKLGDVSETENQSRIYLESNPDQHDVRYNFGDFLRLKNEDYKGALNQLQIVLTHEPERIDAILLKGIILSQTGDYRSAETVFKFLSTVHPSALLNLAFLYKDKMNEPEKALKCFKDYVAYKGRNEDTRTFLDEKILAPTYIESLRKELK